MTTGKILSKAPCNEDLFEGNAHQKLANTIAAEIDNDPCCTIIGIDGGWGSGKSNLVGMVEKCLTKKYKNDSEPQNKYHFFTFDAWGHQNDLPRRSILEELTSDITFGETAILNEQDWKIKLENLLAKKKKTSTKIVPSLNFAIVTIALMVALTPIVSAISENIPTSAGKIIFTALVYLVALGFVVFKQIKNMKKYGQSINAENFFTELFLLYKDKIKEDERFETISEREPSTKQFKDWMEDINNSLMAKGKHLVIVIDNMDRLPKQKVQELWSAIHSFFSEKTYSNIKVIVPFDRLHIRNAFQSEDINENMSQNNGVKVAVYGDDFINKTFYVVYHVPVPILSEWKAYFEYQWKQAFGKDFVVDNAVLQVYDLLTKEHSPRKIVAFINEFVTIKQIVDSSIPDKYIALFIFGRSEIVKNPIQVILEPNYLGTLEYLYKNDKDMPGYISALFYQLPVNDAIDVIYTRQFTQELNENKLDSITTMCASGLKKFFAIMERAIADVSNVGNAALALQTLFADKRDKAIENFWYCLYRKDNGSRQSLLQYQPYHKFILSHIKEQKEYLSYLLPGYLNAIKEDSDIMAYADGIDELASVEGIDLYNILSKKHVEISAMQFVELVEKKKDGYKRYGLICNEHKLSEYLTGMGINGWGQLSIIPSLDSEDYALNEFTQTIEDAIKKLSTDSKSAKILFARLKELKNDTIIKYTNYFGHTVLEQLYRSADQEFKVDLMAMRLSSLNSFNVPSSAFLSDLNKQDEDFVAKIARVIPSYCDYGSMLIGLEQFSVPLMKRVCLYVTKTGVGAKSMNIADVAKKFDVIIANSDISATELFVRMNDWHENEGIITQDAIPSLPLSFIQTAKEQDCELATYILNLVQNYINSITQQDWEKYISNENCQQIKLIKLYHPKKIQPFFDAFKQLMKGYASGDLEKPLPNNTVNEVIEISIDVKHDVKKLFREIRDIFISKSVITAPKLKYFSQWIFEFGNLEQKTESLDRLLPSEILDDATVIDLMISHKDIVKSMIQQSSNTKEFILKMQSMLDGNYKNDSAFSELCDYLEIVGKEEEMDEDEVS